MAMCGELIWRVLYSDEYTTLERCNQNTDDESKAFLERWTDHWVLQDCAISVWIASLFCKQSFLTEVIGRNYGHFRAQICTLATQVRKSARSLSKGTQLKRCGELGP